MSISFNIRSSVDRLFWKWRFMMFHDVLSAQSSQPLELKHPGSIMTKRAWAEQCSCARCAPALRGSNPSAAPAFSGSAVCLGKVPSFSKCENMMWHGTVMGPHGVYNLYAVPDVGHSRASKLNVPQQSSLAENTWWNGHGKSMQKLLSTRMLYWPDKGLSFIWFHLPVPTVEEVYGEQLFLRQVLIHQDWQDHKCAPWQQPNMANVQMCVFPDCSTNIHINSPFFPSIHSDRNDQVLGNPVIHADATDRLELPDASLASRPWTAALSITFP